MSPLIFAAYPCGDLQDTHSSWAPGRSEVAILLLMLGLVQARVNLEELVESTKYCRPQG